MTYDESIEKLAAVAKAANDAANKLTVAEVERDNALAELYACMFDVLSFPRPEGAEHVKNYVRLRGLE